MKIILILFFFLLLPVIYSTESIVVSGFNMSYEVVYPSSAFVESYDYPLISSYFLVDSDFNLKTMHYNFSHSSSSSDTNIFIYSSRGNPSSLICNTGFGSSNLKDCIINYNDNLISQGTYYAYVCTSNGHCSLSFPFLGLQRDRSEWIRSGFKLTVDYEEPASLFIDSYDYPLISSYFLVDSDFDLKTMHYNFSHSPSSSDTNIFIYSSRGNPSSLICNTGFGPSSLKDCIINYNDNLISQGTYYAYICTSNGHCSLSYPFLALQRDRSEWIRSGFKVTVDYEEPSSAFVDSYNYPQISSYFLVDSDFDLKTMHYNFSHSPSSSDTNIFIYSSRGNPSSLICNTGFGSSSLKDCIINYNDNLISQGTYYAYICTSNGHCSLSYPFLALQRDRSEWIRSGFKITYNRLHPSSAFVDSYDYPQISSYFLVDSDFNLKTMHYNFSHSPSSSDTNIFIYSSRGNPSSLICNTGFGPSSLKDCIINYNDNLISQGTYYAYICTSNGHCSLSYPFLALQRDTSEWIRSGFKITLQNFLIQGPGNHSIITGINYVAPTPPNNFRKYNLENFTLNVTDNGDNVSGCIAEIDGTNYTMNYSGGYCYDTYSTNINDTPISINFRVYYTIEGVDTPLPLRTIHIYPEVRQGSLFSGFGLVAFLLTILLIFLGGFRRK